MRCALNELKRFSYAHLKSAELFQPKKKNHSRTPPPPLRIPSRLPTPALSSQPPPQPQPQPQPAPAARRAQKSPSPSPSPSRKSSPRLTPSPSRLDAKPSSPPREVAASTATKTKPSPPPTPTTEGSSLPPSPLLSSAPSPESAEKPSSSQSQPPAERTPQIPTKPIEKSEEELASTDPLPEKAPTPAQLPKPQSKREESKQEPEPSLLSPEHRISDEKPGEVLKERTKANSELKQDIEPSEQQKLDKEPKSIPDDKTKPSMEARQEIHASQEPKLNEKPESMPKDKTETDLEPKQETQASQVPKLDERPKEITEQKAKPKPEKEQERKPTETLKSDRIAEESKKEKPQTEAEIRKKPTDARDKKMERALSSMMADVQSDTKVRVPEKLKDEEKVNSKEQHRSIGKVSKVSISTGPWDSSCDDERPNIQKEIKEGLSKLVQKLTIEHSGRTGIDQGVSILTLAGKNKGATMFIGSKKQGKDDVMETKGEERSRDTPVTATVNSNVQSINNSVLNESKCEEKNPGVHLVVSSKPTEPVSIKGLMEALKPQKTASSVTTPQKLTYEPNVRRRCLRGLFMEPSEDDIEDPQKPRRHGCRVRCDEQKKGKEGKDDEGTSKRNY
ncbi:uncharacterized protein A4U43_C05F10840 [Asparagus officinalis]|uniref:Uncharacterized protein n=1 Tax=Asparagus officinalis TaxID=4686 RepID=A0A5P1EQU2_ASPOF|nr:uncharacterized protein A4U43_C05F10840 [Asparagus officinalis]